LTLAKKKLEILSVKTAANGIKTHEKLSQKLANRLENPSNQKKELKNCPKSLKKAKN